MNSFKKNTKIARKEDERPEEAKKAIENWKQKTETREQKIKEEGKKL